MVSQWLMFFAVVLPYDRQTVSNNPKTDEDNDSTRQIDHTVLTSLPNDSIFLNFNRGYTGSL